jgi:hypothetical protein
MKAVLSAGRLLVMMTRRTILQVAGAMVPGMVRAVEAAGGGRVHVSANTYGWGTYAGRDGRGFSQWSDEALGQMAAAGQSGFEPSVGDVREFDGLGEKLKRHGLEMRSIYGGTRLAAQELEGQVVEGEGALFRIADLKQARGSRPAELDRVVVAVDPPASAHGDACGIVVVGRRERRAFVLADRTVRGLSPGGWAACVGLGIMHVTGQGAIAWALGRLPASVTSVVVLVQPVVATVLGWLLFGEVFGPGQMLGGAIALTGVILAQRAARPAAQPG